MDSTTKANELFTQAWDETPATSDGTERKAIPIAALLTVFIDVAQLVLTACPLANKNGANLQAVARAGSGATRFAIRRQVRGELVNRFGPGAYHRYDGDRMVESILSAASKAEPADIDTFISQLPS